MSSFYDKFKEKLNNFCNRFNIKRRKKSRKKKKNDTNQSAETLKHSQSYSFLLDFYVRSARISIIMKNLFKCIFFTIVMGILICIVVIFWNIIKYVFNSYSSLRNINDISLETILSMISLILPAISSLIVAFIKIPEVIARYLFNIKEDDNMSKIIKDIQNYDRDMFELEHKVEEALMSGRTDDSNNEDDDIEESPTARINQ